MSYPPLTSAELNKFAEACKHNNMAVFDKYYQKMVRHNVSEQAYINAAEDGIAFAISSDNHEMFDKLMQIGKHGVGRYLVNQIVRHAVPHHVWALEKTLNDPNLPAFDDTVPHHTLEKWVNEGLSTSEELDWLVAHSTDSGKTDAAKAACQLRQWDLAYYFATHLDDIYRRWRVGLDAAAHNCPTEVLKDILDVVPEEDGMRLLEERKHVFSADEYINVWSAFSQAYSSQQAQRIHEQLDVDGTAPLKRKM